MKKILIIIIMLFNIFSITVYSQEKRNIVKAEDYDYPYHNKNVATIVGSSTLMTEGVTPYEELDVSTYKIDINGDYKVPESLWYEEGYRFSLTKQKGEAPLIFLIAGTGAYYDSPSMKRFQQILYDAGYHVITVTSSITGNFVVNASTHKIPGSLLRDSYDMYNVLEKSYEKVKKKIKVRDFYLAGYSLGAAQSAFLSYIDEDKKSFNFKRVYMINPVVNIIKSAIKLDKLFDDNLKPDKSDVGPLVDELLVKISEEMKNRGGGVDTEVIYSIFKDFKLTDKQMETLIGLSFRLTSINTHYIVDLANNRGVYIGKDEVITKTTPLFPYYRKINFASFYKYLENLVIPELKERGVPYELAMETLDIRSIDNYIRTTDKIVAVTNQDELILDEDDIKYLENLFGEERIIIYPYGGHCGNMFYKSNVETMIRFLNTGRLTHEKK